jgi:DNA mismatch endonuclease (patch repair protein)
MMAGIRSKNTRPEMLVRRSLHAAGFRFRLHQKRLPGNPDIVLSKYHAVIFVHGCFWHSHECDLFRWPSTRQDFWRQKLARNRKVDTRAAHDLLSQKWRVFTVWECALKGKGRLPIESVSKKTVRWLLSYRSTGEVYGRYRLKRGF